MALSCALALGVVALSPPVAGQTGAQPPQLAPARSVALVRGDGPGEVREPRHVSFAPDGSLYLTDPRRRAVLRFDTSLTWTGAVETAGARLEHPIAAVADERGRVYVADAERRTIVVLGAGGTPREIGGRGSEPGRFDRLTDLAIDADGYLYAADPSRGRVQVFSPDGLLERAIFAFGAVRIEEPALVAVDRARRVYVYDRAAQRIVAGDPDGTLAWQFPTVEHVDGRDDVVDLEVDAHGTLWVLSRERRAALAVSRTGTHLGTYFGREGRPAALDRPVSIAISPEGSFVVLDAEDRRIQALSLSYAGNPPPLEVARRTHVAELLPPTPHQPVAMARAARGAPERWLWRTGSGVSLGEPGQPPNRPVAVPGGVPERVVGVGTDRGFAVVAADERIVLLDRDGRIAGSIPTETSGGSLRRPRAIAWRAEDGAFAVYDAEDHDLFLLGSDGAFQRRIGRLGPGPGEVQDVVGLAFDSEGRLLVADQRGGRIQLFDRSGVLATESAGSPQAEVRRGAFAGLGADAWGRVFLLHSSGVVVQLNDEGGVDCQGGDPRRSREPTGLVVSPGGVAYVLPGREGAPVGLRCVGPPPRPRSPTLAVQPGDRPRVVVRWEPVPEAGSYEVYRQVGSDWRVVGTAAGTELVLPDRSAAPAPISVVALDAAGRRGPSSYATVDRLSPAFGALEAGRAREAEPLLVEATGEARAAGADPGTLTALVQGRVWAAAALGEYERALGLVDQELAPLAPGAVAGARLLVHRQGASAALAQGDGEVALQWLEILAAMPGAELAPVESRALDLARRGDRPTAVALLARYGMQGAALAGGRLAAAVAEVQVSLGRTADALAELAAAAGTTPDPALRQELEEQLFDLAERAMAASSDPAVLAPLESYVAGLDPLRAEAWAARLGALRARPLIQEAIALEAYDFAAAREKLRAILAEGGGLLVDDEIRVRAHLGALALAQGETTEARAQFAAALALRPDWIPDPEEYSPSVRAFVEEIRAGGRT